MTFKHTYLLCIFLFCSFSQSWAANVKNIRIGVKENFTRMVFDLNEKPDVYNIKYLGTPERIILDFSEGNINKHAIKSMSAYPLINKINGTNFRDSGFSIEVELKESANFKHFVLPPTKKTGYRLVVDVTPGEHRYPTKDQTVIPKKPQTITSKKLKKNYDHITDYKSDAIKLYDNKVLSDATLDQLFQPFLGNTQLRNPYYNKPFGQNNLRKSPFKADSSAPTFDVRGYKIKGNSLLSLDILKESVKPYTGTDKNFSDVQHALESLELNYKQLGYGMVQVYLPEQELTKGIITFNVIEPKISLLTVQGANNFSLKNIQESMVDLKKGTTPNTRDIAKNLSLINENPAKKTTVQFISADKEGLLNAVVNVEDKPLSTYSVLLDNTGSDSTGDLRIGLAYQHANITNNDDVFNFQYTMSDKSNTLDAYSLGYHLPLYSLNSSIDIFGGFSDVDSGVIQNLYRVSGQGTVLGSRFNQILSRIDNYSHRISYGMDYREYITNAVLLTGGDSIIPDIKVHPISATYSGQWTSPGQATGFNFQYHLNAFTSENDDVEFNSSRTGAKASYSIIRFGVEHAQSFAQTWQMRVALTGQQTSDALISGEQFGAGGANSVRGYNERDVTNDKGFQATTEVYTPNFAKSVGINGDLRALFFYDAAKLSRNNPQAGDTVSSSITGIGAGIRLNYKDNFSLKLDIASPQKATTTQIKGETKVHFSLKYDF